MSRLTITTLLALFAYAGLPSDAAAAKSDAVATVSCNLGSTATTSCTTSSLATGPSSMSCTSLGSTVTCRVTQVSAGPDILDSIYDPDFHLVVTDTSSSAAVRLLFVTHSSFSGNNVTITYSPMPGSKYTLVKSSTKGATAASQADYDGDTVADDLKVTIDGKSKTFLNAY